MNRHFKVINLDYTRKYDYRLVSDEFLKKLKRQQELGEITLFCCCSNEIEMKLSNTQIPYLYPATRTVKHASNCLRNPDFQSKIEYENGWKLDDEGKFRIKINQIMGIPKDEKVEGTGSSGKSKNYVQVDGKGKVEITVLGLASKLNMMAWETIISQKERLPEDKFEVSRYIFGKSKSVFLSNKSSRLQDMFIDEVLKKRKISKLTVKSDLVYVYLYYDRTDVEKIGSSTYDVVIGKNAFDSEVGLYIPDMNEFQQKFQNEPHSDQFVLAGFAYRVSKYHHRKLTLGNYCIMPVTEHGLFVESKNEKETYEEIYRANKTFIKPYLPIVEHYNDFVPDYIIYEDGEKPLVGEIFGIQGNPDYDERKSSKINLSEKDEFKNLYRFEYKEL